MNDRLPGDASHKQLIDQMIRVNHAGEYGAKRIYEGQLAVLKNTEAGRVIEHMKQQELAHLKYFEEQLVVRKARPSILHPLWHVAGFALGAITAAIGEKTAYACTVAVEEAIDEHYADQLNKLDDSESELRAKITQFKQEELEHKETATNHQAMYAPLYPALSNVIKTGCKLAIWLAKRF
jgi:ubiquinone biosynthesis monooxygenase Coq7